MKKGAIFYLGIFFCIGIILGVSTVFVTPVYSIDCVDITQCPEGTYCGKIDGDCGGLGTCMDLPEACFTLWDPVCGCDGRTYSNGCFAAMNGVNVDYAGECVNQCTSNIECPDEYWCRKNTGNCEGEGLCYARPDQCTTEWDPVCGCDGRTYSNGCVAAMSGVNVDYLGECVNQCTSNTECPDEYWCRKNTGNCEGEGLCYARPDQCTTELDPVCGCDGNTYPNACFAAMNGVNVDYFGECVHECTSNSQCSDQDYCDKATGDCDGSGICRERPDLCPSIWDPVCGCDGVTYSNTCIAAANGVNVDYGGECLNECTSNVQCPDEDYCEKAVGNCDGLGICRDRPDACPEIWDPVCGCDGVTYSNTCFAAANGVSVDYRGECRIQGCITNDQCSTEDYCKKAVGDCEGEGMCDARPLGCPDVWEPVCGCDGQTYSNACDAAASGVNVDYEGECKNICTNNEQCPSDYYCMKPPGDCIGPGKCEKRPDGCFAVWDPVCGCDNVTYSNACYAALNGVNVNYEGECMEECTSNTQCPPESYCMKTPGNCGGQGMCAGRPDACLDIWDPVCGCDGRTYSNECYAAVNGVNVDYEGECEKCISNNQCSSDDYCQKAAGDCDGLGICRDRPDACIALWDPVCGCDGLTYSNACYAAINGVNVDYKGECKEECTSNNDCLEEDYCRKTVGDCAGKGMCADRPDACPKVLDPVCGCDGVTYSNACYAALNGVNVDYEGECEKCISNKQCSSDDYCQKAAGDCDGLGICRDRPDACLDVWDPVCGCDGRTYSNACYAAINGVNVDYEGECKEECTSNNDCLEEDYCRKAVGDCAGKGMCADRPDACPRLWEPVCGCDGRTYSNACFAALNGVNVDYEGECKRECKSNVHCSDEDYCKKDLGDCEGIGLCTDRPLGCPDVWDPVCGCDGKTYSNDCDAAANGVSVDYPGECASRCTNNAQCSSEDYCQKSIGDCDGSGICRDRPDVCPDVWDPVCGCDGVTYSNACDAAAVGVNVDYKGECKSCTNNEECSGGDYCSKSPGDCDGEGMCKDRPDACIDLWDPVCGCDGRTYSNDCYAAMNGVNVDYKGECIDKCISNADCSPEDYCRKIAGNCEGEGTCAERPDGCITLMDPVCGCDGITYSNACVAAMNGVNVDYKGVCKRECTTNEQCATDDYCKKDVGDCNGEGMCTDQPDICPALWDPVCGCDGVTYPNVCSAALHGVSIDYAGECKQECTTNAQCSTDDYCKKDIGDCEGQGMCTDRPTICPTLWDPVCGCDGITYANECVAAANGINVYTQGECPCIFTATITATGQIITGIENNISKVKIGLNPVPFVIEAPPSPPPDYTVVLNIAGGEYGFKEDFREPGLEREEWELDMIVGDKADPNYPGFFPMLSWDPNALCPLDPDNGYSLKLYSEDDQGIRTLLIPDMTLTSHYQTKEEDGLCFGGNMCAFTYYVVWSKDVSVEMKLSMGWSMISLPVIPIDATLSALFPDAEVVYRYEKGSGYVRLQTYEEMKVGVGYWMLVYEDQNYVLTGQPIHSYTTTVYEDGWEMIGGCTAGARPATDSCDIGVIYRFVRGSGYMRVFDSELMQHGEGFWILLKEIQGQCELTVEGVGSLYRHRARSSSIRFKTEDQDGVWTLPIKVTGQGGDASIIHIGMKSDAETYLSPGPIPDYTIQIALSDGLLEDYRQAGSEGEIWNFTIEITPDADPLQEDYYPLLSWNPENIPGPMKLVCGLTEDGEVLIDDMRDFDSYQTTEADGENILMFTIVFEPETDTASYKNRDEIFEIPVLKWGEYGPYWMGVFPQLPNQLFYNNQYSFDNGYWGSPFWLYPFTYSSSAGDQKPYFWQIWTNPWPGFLSFY